MRSYDTSPGRVRIVTATGPIDAVPVLGGNATEPELVGRDPAGYIRSAISRGPVYAMIKAKSHYIWGQLPDGIGAIEVVDQAALRGENEREFALKLAALRNSAQADEATAWYGAARFAFQNRLDEHVTDMLDQALALDPFLSRTVREAKAQQCCAAMLMQIRLGNKDSGARAWLAILTTRYADTATGRIAPELYQGNAHLVVALARERDERLAREASERERALLQRAMQDGGPAEVERLNALRQAGGAPAAAAPALKNAVPGDEMIAQQAMDGGYAIMRPAMNMPPTSARNDQYRAALARFEAAIDQYRALIAAHPDDEAIATKLVEANEDAAACRKYCAPF